MLSGELCMQTVSRHIVQCVQSRYSVLSHKNLEDGDREPRQLVCYFRSCSATLLKEHAHFTTGISRVHLCHLYSSGTWLPYTVLSLLSVKLDPAHSTKLMSIIVYFCNPSQESLDLCKPKSAWWHHFYWKWCHRVLLSDPQCNQEFHEIVTVTKLLWPLWFLHHWWNCHSHKAVTVATVPTPLMELSQSQSCYGRYGSYTTDGIVTVTKPL